MATFALQSHICSLIISDVFLRGSPAALHAREELIRTRDLTSVSKTNFIRLLNILMYFSEDYFVCFFPTGRKYSDNLLTQKWQQTRTGSITSIKEISIPYNDTLLQNIKAQFPEYLQDFTQSHGKFQREIFGYFVICDRKYHKQGIEISHVFTNTNTHSFLTTHSPYLEEKEFSNIKNILKTKTSCFKSCVVGAAAVKLFGDPSKTDYLKTEIWSYDKNIEHVIEIDSQRKREMEKKTKNKVIKTIRLGNKKIHWNNTCFLVPYRHVDLIKSELWNNAIDFICDEDIFCYYKGVKFLYARNNNETNDQVLIKNLERPISAVSTKRLNLNKANKKTRITNVWTSECVKVCLYRNCFLSDLKYLPNNEAIWILNKNSSVDLMTSTKTDYLPWLTLDNLAVGKVKKTKTGILIFPGNRKSDCKVTIQHLKANLANSESMNFEFKNFSRTKIVLNNTTKKRQIKEKIPIIQDERQRDNISALFALLSGN